MLIMKRDQITVARKMQQSENQMCRFRASVCKRFGRLQRTEISNDCAVELRAYRYALFD